MLFEQNSESVPITSTFSTISTPQHILNQCQCQWTQNEISRVQRRGSLNSHLRRDIEGFAHIRVPLHMCMCVTRGAWAQIVWTAFPILKSSLMHCAHDLPIQVHVLFLILIVFSLPSPVTILMIMILQTAFPILSASWCVPTIFPFKFSRVFARDADLGRSKSRVQNMAEIWGMLNDRAKIWRMRKT